VTWGSQAAQFRPDSDAAIAARLARELGLEHRYYPLDVDAGLDPQLVIDRFVRAGEGCVDHLSGYVDGFDLWSALARSGVRTIVRGDEGFGARASRSESEIHTRMNLGLALMEDYSNLRWIGERGLLPQSLPAELRRQNDETPATWRDRVYHAYRISSVFAPLHELKAPYVEIVTPLLANSVVGVVRKMPDDMRTDKMAFRRFVESVSPAVPFATTDAIEPLSNLLERPEMRRVLRRAMESFSVAMVPHAISEMAAEALTDGARAPKHFGWRPYAAALARRLPTPARTMLRQVAPSGRLNTNLLAFRICIANAMASLLTEDKQAMHASLEKRGADELPQL
jgi:hypothetical protein